MSIDFKDDKIFTAIRLFRQAFGQYKWQILILTVLGFLGGLMEAVGINAIIPLFSFILEEPVEGADFITRYIEQIFIWLHIDFKFSYLLIFIALLFISKALLMLLANYINTKITATYEKDMRSEMFEKVLDTNWGFLLQQKIGYLEKVIMDHVSRTSEMLRYFSSTIILITSLIMYALVALNISVMITLLTLSVGGVMFLVFKPLTFKIRNVSKNFSDNAQKAANLVNENMIGMKTVKAMAKEKQVSNKGDEYFDNLKKARIKLSVINAIPLSFLQPISVIFILILFALSYRATEFNLVSFAVIVYLIQKIFAYVQNAQSKLQTAYETVPYLRSVVDHKKLINKHKENKTGANRFKFNNSLKFDNVDFDYGMQKNKILEGVSFKIKPGEMVGLIGPSGAGKTTIVDLILRLFEPISGQILLDNQNIKNLDLKIWRQNIGYVSQDIFLLNQTIENNIRFYDKKLTRKQIEEAARAANIYKFINSLPDKFNTYVGEQGVMLSQGQRQRIILARVLARRPKILILDEATSALDNESEVAVQKAIQELKGKITTLVIAHRLSTVMNTDKLIVIEDGKIKEQDEPAKLLKDKNSYFHQVYHIRKK